VRRKADGRLRIGELSTRSGVPAKTIRFYEHIGLIERASRTSNRYRSYGESDVQTLRFIHRARGLGFSVAEVNALLALYRDRRRASRDVKRLALEHVAELDRRIADLTAIRDTLADLARRCHGDMRPECPILDELEAAVD
jgi:MerR family transcriptional regulator, copper efflux regulator